MKRDDKRREKCRRELEIDKEMEARGAMITVANSEWDVAVFLWGMDEADRLYPEIAAERRAGKERGK